MINQWLIVKAAMLLLMIEQFSFYWATPANCTTAQKEACIYLWKAG